MKGRFGLGLLVVGLSAALFGCPKKEQAAADAGAPTASAPTASASAAAPQLADNQADVTQYPDQVAAAGNAPVGWFVANVRSQASSGAPLISVLKKGTDTTKIATKDTFTLITFKEPSAPGRTLMGWMDTRAYQPQIWDAGPQCVGCPAGLVSIMLEGGHQQCVLACNSANDACPTAQVCGGDAPKCVKGQVSDSIEFCIPGNKKGSPNPTPPTVTDAGPTPPPVVQDASAPPVVADAAPPGPAKALRIAHKADAGACPATYIQATPDFCMIQCTTLNTQDVCPAGSVCKSFSGGTVHACAG
jgi:hypothetical protein